MSGAVAYFADVTALAAALGSAADISHKDVWVVAARLAQS